MMGLSTIRAMSDEAAEKAANENQEPYVFWSVDDLDHMDSFPFPFIGDYVPDGWELVETYFVDASGFGRVGEPALTRGQFESEIRQALRDEPVGTGWALTEVGQFQVRVGRFRRT